MTRLHPTIIAASLYRVFSTSVIESRLLLAKIPGPVDNLNGGAEWYIRVVLKKHSHQTLLYFGIAFLPGGKSSRSGFCGDLLVFCKSVV